MNAPSRPAAPASGPATPATDDSPDGFDLASLMADPEIAPLLEFEPVPRQREVERGWTPELQREFIARLAVHGAPGRACEEMGKTLTGMMKLYRSPLAASFRAAWHGAVELAKRRRAARASSEYVQPGSRPPTLDHRRKHPHLDPSAPAAEGWGEDPEISEDQKWDLIHNIGVKFMRKVAAERQARLAGEIVAADFYLRQITMLEVVFDLTCGEFGWDAGDVLRELRRGEHGVREIVSTPLADWLDQSRRLWWSQEGEPERPPHPDVRFLARHRSDEGDYSTYADQHTYGALTPPARGYSEEQWAAMHFDEQVAARERQWEEDAAEQAEWERRAHAEWEERQEGGGR